MIGEFLDRTIRRERDRSQVLRAREPPVQHLARDLEDRLREVVVELQFVRPRRVVERELAGLNDGLTAVLQHRAHAAFTERDQDEVLVRARDPRRRAEHPLPAGGDFRAFGRAKRRAGDRAMECRSEVGLAIELDEDVTYDVLPERQSPVRGRFFRGEQGRHDFPPFTSWESWLPKRLSKTPTSRDRGKVRTAVAGACPRGSRIFLPSPTNRVPAIEGIMMS